MGGVVDRSAAFSGVFSFAPRFFGFDFLSLRLSVDDSLVLCFGFAGAKCQNLNIFSLVRLKIQMMMQ